MKIISFFWVFVFTCSVVAVFGGDLEELTLASREVVEDFAGELKGELKGAIRKGGVAYAIPVCRENALLIASKVSARSGWRVARTSLKVRNPANAPDLWEERVLLMFEDRRAAGEDPKEIEYAEIVKVGGKKTFRYMKAIPTVEICLLCHGTDLLSSVESRLDELYPGDRARGFSVGDIRGAFTVAQPLE